MTNLLPTIAPKSDQLNADDLIGRTLTIKVTKVSLCEAPDQPIAVHFEGDGGKPYKPCKSMRRVLVNVWGSDGNAYVGRRMALYRDDKVQFGGLAVGGIRISHMSDITSDVTMALTATRANRKPFTVKPLPPERPQEPRHIQSDSDGFPGDRTSSSTASTPPTANNGGGDGGSPLTLEQRCAAFLKRVAEAPNRMKLKAIGAAAEALKADLDRADPDRLVEIMEVFQARDAELEEAERLAAMEGAE